MKQVLYILFFSMLAPVLVVGADNPTLPAIRSLKELPVELVKDFTGNKNIASPAQPVAAGEGSLFFYDYKLKQLGKANLEDDTITAVGRFGEGPKAYAGTASLWGDEAFVYCVDRKGKLHCFDPKGEFLWEDRLDKVNPRLVGMGNGGIFFYTFSRYSSKVRSLRLFNRQKDKRALELMTLPVEFIAMKAYSNGKLLKGGGVMNVAVPAVALWDGMLVTSAYRDYRFDLRDLSGKQKSRVTMAAPAPQINPLWKKFKNIDVKKLYAIREIYPFKSTLAVVSNYYREDKPRIDFFDKKGTLLQSYILPFKANGGGDSVSIQGGYLFFWEWRKTGFKIYKINAKI